MQTVYVLVTDLQFKKPLKNDADPGVRLFDSFDAARAHMKFSWGLAVKMGFLDGDAEPDWPSAFSGNEVVVEMVCAPGTKHARFRIMKWQFDTQWERVLDKSLAETRLAELLELQASESDQSPESDQ